MFLSLTTLKSADKSSKENHVQQLQRHGRPEGAPCGPAEEVGLSGGRDDAAEDGVAVPEVVLQRRHLLGVLLGGEDLRGELSQLGEKTKNKTLIAEGGKLFTRLFRQFDRRRPTCDQEMRMGTSYRVQTTT